MPWPTGSATAQKTIGIVGVAFQPATTERVPPSATTHLPDRSVPYRVWLHVASSDKQRALTRW